MIITLLPGFILGSSFLSFIHFVLFLFLLLAGYCPLFFLAWNPPVPLVSCSLLLRSAALGVLVSQHGWGIVWAGYCALSRATARLKERSRGLSRPLTCSSTAEGSFGRVIAPSHVLEHGWGSVLAGYCALSCARARLGERFGGLSRPIACSSTAGGALGALFVPRGEPGVSRCLMRRLTGRWRERRQGGQGVRRSWRLSRKGCPRRRRGWRWRCGRSCRGARPRSKRRGWRRS